MDVLFKNDIFLFIYVTEITRERQTEGEGGADSPGEQGACREAPPPQLSQRQMLTRPSHPGALHVPLPVYPPTPGRHLGCVLFGALRNNAAWSVRVLVLVVPFLLGVDLGVDISFASLICCSGSHLCL